MEDIMYRIGLMTQRNNVELQQKLDDLQSSLKDINTSLVDLKNQIASIKAESNERFVNIAKSIDEIKNSNVANHAEILEGLKALEGKSEDNLLTLISSLKRFLVDLEHHRDEKLHELNENISRNANDLKNSQNLNLQRQDETFKQILGELSQSVKPNDIFILEELLRLIAANQMMNLVDKK